MVRCDMEFYQSDRGVVAMKTIGRTNQGGYLVEMNPDEHGALTALACAENGWESMGAYYRHSETASIDLSTPIGAIRHYARSISRLNELRRLLNDLEDTYKNEDDEYDS